MSDIANIGFKAETSDLDKAAAKLKALGPAAQVAAGGVTKVAQAAAAANAATANAAYEAAKAVYTKAKADRAVMMASGQATKADLAAAKAARDVAMANMALAKAERDRVNAANAAAAATRKTEAASQSYTQALKRQADMAKLAFNTAAGAPYQMPVPGQPMPANDQLPNRFNTANIAAQFQDIGVTASMGMNPLVIAMQQGTQLSAILNSMESPLKGIAIAFRQIINPVALLSIGIVGLVAAGIQMVDWIKVAQGAVNILAGVFDFLADHIVGLSLLITGLSAVLLALYGGAIVTAINGFLVMGTTALAAGAKMAAAWVMAMGPVGWVLTGIAAVVTAVAAFNQEISKILGYDIVQGAKTGVNQIIGFFVGAFNGIVALFKNLPDMLKGVIAGTGANAGEIFGREFKAAMEKDYVGAAGDMLAGIGDSLRKYSFTIGAGDPDKKKSTGKSQAEHFEDIVNGAERSIESLKAEKAALGMTEYAASRLRHETDLLNEAKQKNINLTPAQRRVLGELAETMAQLEEETRKTKEMIDFAKDASRGFMTDMRNDLQQGKSLWESFGNAVTNVLNKIIDKLGEMLIEDAFDMLSSSSGGSNGGLGFLGDALGFLFNSKGNAFGSNGVQEFAKGGAFTNGVYSSPTLFQFAKGGGFGMGVMGEAGHEAVMPLHRGSDGSLGVRVDGGNLGGSNVSVVINNNSGAKASVQQRESSNGIEIEVMIDEMVAEKIGDQSSLTNRSLNAKNSRALIRRG